MKTRWHGFARVWVLALPVALASAATWLGEEHFGNEPLAEANFADWPGIVPVVNDSSRVYHSWVNGDESCYYSGSIEALNACLRRFAEVKLPIREVVVRPGPGRTESFHGKPIGFRWQLHLVGGIARHMTGLDQGAKVWSDHPILHIFVDEVIRPEAIQFPEGVTVTGLDSLKARYIEALSSTDLTVRGWACEHVVAADRYDDESAKAVAALLEDKEPWVRLNAALALPGFGSRAQFALPALAAAGATEDAQLAQAARQAAIDIQAAKENEQAAADFAAARAAIAEMLKSRLGR